MELALPFRELPAAVALAEALIFAAFLAVRSNRGVLSNALLIVIFLLLASVKFDQLFQMLGGVEAMPSLAFVFTPVQWLLTPAIYFFIVSKVNTQFKFKRIHLLNLLPCIGSFIYMWFSYYSLSLEDKLVYLGSGALSEAINAIYIPFASDLLQLAYLWAALLVMNKYGVTLRNWFSRVDSSNIDWAKRIIVILMISFLGHMLFSLTSGIFEQRHMARLIIDGLNILHLLLINGLMFFALLMEFAMAPAESQLQVQEKYSKSALNDFDRTALFKRAEHEMMQHKHYLNPELDLGELAAKLAVSPRELSEAINGVGGQSFYEFVNHYRIEAVKQALIKDPMKQILLIAYDCGFNSKSAFNQLFKKYTGSTPTGYKKLLRSEQDSPI